MPNVRKKPVHEIRICRIKATLWEQEVDNRKFLSTTIVRLYKDGKYWKESSSFSLSDLPLVAKVADQALSFVFDRMQECRSVPIKPSAAEEIPAESELNEPLEDYEHEQRKHEFEHECGQYSE